LKRVIKTALLAICAALVFAIVPALYFFLSYYNSLEQEVVTRMSNKQWTIPSLVFSDATTIYPGQKLDDIGFFQRLARLNYHRV
jgi:hypothetical protein